MSKHKQYVVGIALIFCGQIFLASLFMLSSDGSEIQQKQIALLRSQNKSLSAKLKTQLKLQSKNLDKKHQREVASLPDSDLNQHDSKVQNDDTEDPEYNDFKAQYAKDHKVKLSDLKFDLTDFYFTQIEKHKKNKNNQGVLEAIKKLQESGADKDHLAQAEYEKINILCNQNLEMSCMKEIDLIVSQFPDSNWTAKSLLLLSHFYYKQNRINEAKSLIQVIQKEFKAYDMAYDIQKISKQNL